MRSAPIPDEQLPADLLHLRHLYARVPDRVDIKFRLVPGQKFLIALADVAGRYPVTQIAAALGVSTTAVYQMRKHPLDPAPYRWPTDTQMAALNRAWLKVKGRGYLSREHLAVHRALRGLLDNGFVVTAIARRMKVPVADLEKFVKTPIGPALFSQRVQRALKNERIDPDEPTLARLQQ